MDGKGHCLVTLGTHLMAEILDVIAEQLGLFWGDLESSGPEGGQHFPQDPEMRPGVGGVDGRVIEVTKDLRRGKMS